MRRSALLALLSGTALVAGMLVGAVASAAAALGDAPTAALAACRAQPPEAKAAPGDAAEPAPPSLAPPGTAVVTDVDNRRRRASFVAVNRFRTRLVAAFLLAFWLAVAQPRDVETINQAQAEAIAANFWVREPPVERPAARGWADAMNEGVVQPFNPPAAQEALRA